MEEELGFGLQTALRYVQSYELFKSNKVVGFDTLQIDVSALYLLARKKTPAEVRAEALEKAATEGISHAEVQKLIADAKAEAAAKAKEEADKAAVAKLAEAKKAAKDEAEKAAEKSAALIETIRQCDVMIAQARQRIVELEGAAATVAQTVREEYETKYQGKVVISEEELRTSIQATVDQMMAALKSEICGLTATVECVSNERNTAKADLVEARKKFKEALQAAAKKAAEAADTPAPPPIDGQLAVKAMVARTAIEHCVAEIKLSPAELINIEIEQAARLHQRPDLARETLSNVAATISKLTPWFEKFIELYGTEINRDSTRSDAAPAIAAVPSATPPEAEPAETLTAPLQMTEPVPVASPARADQRADALPPKRGRGRPVGSTDKQPRKKKGTLLPTGAQGSRDDIESKAAQSATNTSESAESEIPESEQQVAAVEPAGGLTL